MLSKFIGLFVFYFGLFLNFTIPQDMWELWMLPIPIAGMAWYLASVVRQKKENARKEREEDRLDLEPDPETGRYH